MLRRLLPLLSPFALCALAACATETGAQEDTPVDATDANLDFRAPSTKGLDVTGIVEVVLTGADAALEGEPRAAKIEELARAKIDGVTRALESELARLSAGANVVGVMRMASPKRGSFMVDGDRAAFSYWAQITAPTELVATMPLGPDGKHAVTKLTVEGADVVLEWSDAATAADSYPQYADMFADGVLDIAIQVGGDDAEPRRDLDEARALYDELVALGLRAPGSSFAELRLDSPPFVGSLDVAGKPVEVRATLVHAGMASGDRAGDLATKFEARAKDADVVVYRGHAGAASGVVLHQNPRVAIPASDFDWLDLPSKYQLFVFDGSETYTGYADKLFENPTKDDENTDVFTIVDDGAPSMPADTARAFLHGLLDHATSQWAPRSWNAVLERLNGAQLGSRARIYGVHGRAGNPTLSMLADASKIGRTCATNIDCGAVDSLCVAMPSGRVCGAACADDSACPDGAKCTAVSSRTLGTTKQCLPLR